MAHYSAPPASPDPRLALRASLARRWPLPGEEDLRDALLDAWGSASRGYHDLEHLSEVLDRLDELAPAHGQERPTLALAAWFHDAVYDGDLDPEGRSAAWAREALAGTDVDGDEVARLVLLTRDHSPAPDDTIGAALCDADLAVLASPEPRYRAYVEGVRREYARLDDATFAAGRAAVLRGFLARPRLFTSPEGRRRWDEPARQNAARELARITRGGAWDDAAPTP